MSENRNEKRTVWMYAAILFTCAFIVLLLTAYSQLKFKKNISEYQNKVSTEQKAKLNYMTDLNTALNENKKLKEEIELISQDYQKYKGENSDSEKKYAEIQDKNIKLTNSYEKLIIAQEEFNKGNIVNCAITLSKDFDYSVLGTEALKRYKLLMDSTFKQSAKVLYIEGYKAFSNKNYITAIYNFQQSLNLEPNEYFSDDCLYFISYSEYNRGNKENAVSSINSLLTKYPDSSYKKEALDLLKKIK